MLDVYTVINVRLKDKVIVENFLDYEEANGFRNKLHVEGVGEVLLTHRSVTATGDSLTQRAAWAPRRSELPQTL